MPPKPSSQQFPGHLVTAVIVSHDGARWLPECLAALAAQARPPQRVVAVDTGSTDGSAALLAEALGESAVVRMPASTALGAAVQAGLDAFDGAPAPPGTRGAPEQWVWVLHDDCAPAPTALRELLTEAERSPSVAAWGPKLLSWTGRHLAEVGRTIDSSGAVQTGLEPRELDQGQHDDTGDVLAVSTAGMLLRRPVWDAAGGLDPAWPLFGEDVDLGWRLHARGERVRVAPRAEVRHASAATAGERPVAAVAGRPAAAARRHGLQVVLANTAGWLVPLLVLRYLGEGLARALVLLLQRRPAAAADELAAFAGTLARPDRLAAARRRRRDRTVGHGEIRALLAPMAWRWRHAGDALAHLLGGRDAAADRQRRRAPVESGPVAAETEAFDLDDTGVLLRALRRPGVLLALGLTGVALVADRSLLGGTLHGGRLLPAPGGASDLWSTYLSAWHPVGLGSTTPAPPFLAVLALLSTVLAGKVWLAVDVLLLAAAPLAGLSAYAGAGRLTRSLPLRVGAAVTYSLAPVVTGAVSGGRVDVVLAVVLLPLLVRATAAAVAAPPHRWNRWVGAGLLLAIVTACAPYVWWLALAVAVTCSVLLPGARLRRLLAGAVVVVVPLLLLEPWTATLFSHPRLFLAGSGLPEFTAASGPSGAASLLLLQPGGPDQPPLWVLAPLVLAALTALVRREAGAARAARVTFVVYAVAVAGAVVATRVPGPLTADGDPTRYWVGVPLAVALAGAVAAAVLAADGARARLRRYSFGWRQASAALLAAAVGAGAVAMLAAWLVRGTAGPLTDRPSQLLPIFAAAEVMRPSAPRVLALQPSGGVVRFALVRDAAGPRLGAADVASTRGGVARDRLAAAVREVAAGQAEGVPTLAEFGVSLLVVPNEQAAAVHGLATVDGLSRVPTASAVVWRSAVRTGALVVLPPDVADEVVGGADLPADARPRPLATGVGASRTTVPAGPAGRLLVLAEPADSHWTARLGGRALPATRAYGWAQAWRLPAGGGRLEIGRTGEYRTTWLALELALVVVAAALTLPAGRGGRVPPEPAIATPADQPQPVGAGAAP